MQRILPWLETHEGLKDDMDSKEVWDWKPKGQKSVMGIYGEKGH